MGRLIRILALLLVLACIGGLIWLGTADIPAPSAQQVRNIDHEKFAR